ncbi:Putative vgr related protein [Minicystis rosea]|nr:Putative vgr related protein [Minicystis rosea]
MMPATLFHLFIGGFETPWRAVALAGEERIHAPWSFDVTCTPPDHAAPVDVGALLARPARFGLPTGDDNERLVSGFIDRVVAVHHGYRFTVVPYVAELGDVVDHHVFLGKDAVTIAEEVLATRHLRVERRLTRDIAARAQCVQHAETSLAFVSRILAEEGIAWWLKPNEEDDVLVLSDSPSAYNDVEGGCTLRVAEDAGLDGEDTVRKIRLRACVVSDKVSMRDYDFEHPSVDQSVEAGDHGGGLEVFAYPGGYADPSVGRTVARIRLEEVQREALVLEAETRCRRLAAAHVLSLREGARDDINQPWLVVEVTHALDQHGYLARFRAVPAANGYRPPRPTSPRMPGVQTATVSGPSGSEIHTEAHGRVRAKLRWDRRLERDETSSHWLRVAQPPTSGGFFLPRTGWEVLLGFSGSSADAPFVLARLANGAAPPPEALPARKVVSAFGSLTTPNGGSGNELRLDDSAGAEGMGFSASANYNERTENDKVTGVVGADAHAIGASRKLIVGTVHQVSVTSAQSYTIGGSREVNVNANKSIGAASEAVVIGGARMFTIGGDQTTACSALTRVVGAAKAEAAIEHQHRSVTGSSTIAIGGTWTAAAGAHAGVSVLGASVEQVGGAKNIVCGKYNLNVTGALSETLATRSIRASGDRGEQFGATATYLVGGAAKLAGADVVIKATAKITIKAGGATVTITPGSITIDGAFSGAVASEDHGDEAYG